MAISPIDINIMQRSMDVAQIKHNTDAKPVVEQANLVIQTDKNIQQRTEQVVTGDNATKSNTEHDARQKGKNFYFRNEKEKKKKKEEESDGKVTVRRPTSFDMKI